MDQSLLILINFNSNPQGFAKSQLHPFDVCLVLAAAEFRLKRTFSAQEVRDGTLTSLLIDEDFKILDKVSTLPSFPA